MKPFDILKMRNPGGGGGGSFLDTQTVTVAQSGSTGSRVRGYISGSLGSISDGTSNIFGGNAITEMNYDELAGEFYLVITGSTNTGWTAMTNATDGNTLTRASAVFSGGRWTWAGGSLSSFFVGTSGAKTINFS